MAVVLVEKQSPQITVLTLNRPERRNSLTLELLSELIAAVNTAAKDSSQRVLILRGAGAAFCTGLDLKEAADQTKAQATAEMVAETLITLAETRLVTIAAVHGAAVAGGAGIMSACDFVVAAEKTKIGYPEVRRGLVAGLVMTFLRRQVRERHLRELVLGGKLIDPARAKEIGLVNRAVPAGKITGEGQKFAERFGYVNGENDKDNQVHERDEKQDYPPAGPTGDFAKEVHVHDRNNCCPARLTGLAEYFPHRRDHQNDERDLTDPENGAGSFRSFVLSFLRQE